MSSANTIWDSRNGYGVVSRSFHWLMALLFLWQFMSAILRVLARDSAVFTFFWSAHQQLGFALLVLVLLRGVWGLSNIGRRPHKDGLMGKAALLGHLAIYALMFAVPALALIRAYGRGRSFSFLGMPIFDPAGVQNETLNSIGSTLHGPLGWTLLAVVVCHVFMALFHHFALRDDTLRHMTGHKPKG
jgi:cytochrome b561